MILNQNFQTQLFPRTSLVGDHASTRAAETVLAKESSTQEGKRSSTWDVDIGLKRWTRTNEHLVGTRTDRVMFFGRDGMITLNVVTIMRRNCEEVLPLHKPQHVIGSDEFDTSHAECRIHMFFRGEGDSGFRVQIDPCSHRDRPHNSSH